MRRPVQGVLHALRLRRDCQRVPTDVRPLLPEPTAAVAIDSGAAVAAAAAALPSGDGAAAAAAVAAAVAAARAAAVAAAACAAAATRAVAATREGGLHLPESDQLQPEGGGRRRLVYLRDNYYSGHDCGLHVPEGDQLQP